MMTSPAMLKAIFAAAVLSAAGSTVALSAESAAGAYILGIRGPGAGVTPPTGLFFSEQTYFYNGKISGEVPLDGGPVAGNARINAGVAIPTFLLVTPLEIAGGRLGVSATIPAGHVDVSGQIGPLSRSDGTSTFADPSVTAFLGWKANQFNWQIGGTAFLPIGDYHVGELANVAKHRGALDAFGALTWLEPSLGLDVSNTIGVTFSQQNDVTRYRSGTEFHWEWSVSKRFDNSVSIGPAGYYYNQLTQDSGAGAILGSFKGQVWALGAGVGYEFKVGPLPVTARLRYFHEIETTHRLQGDTAFVGVSFPLWVAGQNSRLKE